MTDRPTAEQQLAGLIGKWYTDHQEHHIIAAAIVAAVESGRIDPIVPEGTVGSNGAELIRLAESAADRIQSLDAELAELRALKAKVDGCRNRSSFSVYLAGETMGEHVLHATDLLAWLRETT